MALYPTLPDAKGTAKTFRNNEEQVYPIRDGVGHGYPANIKEVVLIYSSYTHEHETSKLPCIDREKQ
jgi:hypothetical protein